jgi:hypothetical protein
VPRRFHPEAESILGNAPFPYTSIRYHEQRLVWAGNSGTPTGGDHCMAPPTGTTLPTYSQASTSNKLDRTTSGSAGNSTYAEASGGNAPNPYAAYEAMGNMSCRNVDTTTGHTCGNTPTGALMTDDNQGQLASWTTPSGVVDSAHSLYNNQGNRVLTNSANAGTTTNTISFDGYTETVLSGGTTTTTTYYTANGTRLAVRVGSSTLDSLVGDPLGNNTVTLNSNAQVIALSLGRGLFLLF